MLIKHKKLKCYDEALYSSFYYNDKLIAMYDKVTKTTQWFTQDTKQRGLVVKLVKQWG